MHLKIYRGFYLFLFLIIKVLKEISIPYKIYLPKKISIDFILLIFIQICVKPNVIQIYVSVEHKTAQPTIPRSITDPYLSQSRKILPDSNMELILDDRYVYISN